MELPYKLKIDPSTASLEEIQGEALRLGQVVWEATRSGDITTRQLATEKGVELGTIARIRFPDGQTNDEPTDISHLAYSALTSENIHHKQWYLEKILELSGSNYDKIWKPGIKPKIT